MNKKELIVTVAKDAGITKREAGAALDSVLDTIAEAVARGDSVMLLGFGTFVPKSYGAKSAVNPATGQPMTIAARKMPRFRPHTKFKDLVNV